MLMCSSGRTSDEPNDPDYTLIGKDHLEIGVLRRTVVSDWRFDKVVVLVENLTLKMASAQVVETPVTNNSPSQNSNHPDDLFQQL